MGKENNDKADVKSCILERIARHEADIKMYEKKLKESETIIDCEYHINNIKPLEIRKSELEMVLKYCF